MGLANTTWYVTLAYGAKLTIKFGSAYNNGGSCTINSVAAMWAENNGMFAIELPYPAGSPTGFTTVYVGQYSGAAGTGFASPEFNAMAFPFTMSQTPSKDFVETADWQQHMMKEPALAK